MQLAGSRVLLTGATGGLGQALAAALASRGAQLILSSRRAEPLAALAATTGADVVAAGIDRAIDVNLRAPIQLAHALAPGMVGRRRGHLLFVSSLSGLAATPDACLYAATKFGLRGFALGLRQDLHGTGVGVSVLLPGFISEAGMFADSGAVLPPGVGSRPPAQVADAAIDAIERDRAEVTSAPLPLVAGAYLAGLAPGLTARVQRALGANRVAASVASGQRAKR
jgi:short-subunit dehydrogenase